MSQRLTYTVAEVAEILGISRSTAHECIRRGEIPALTLGRRVVVSRAALSGLLAGSGRKQGTGDSRHHDAAYNER